MAVTHGTPTRNALVSAVATAIGAGGKLKLRTSANAVLATIALSSTPLATPSGGAASLSGLPLSVAASAPGSLTGGNFVVTDSSDVTIFTGSITVTGGGGDLTVDNVTVTSGQTCTVTGGTYTAPA
jgi:lipopolysaccharide export system protein LptA